MAAKKRTPLSVIGTYDINLDGQTIPCIVKRSAKARCVRFEIRLDTGLTVVIPKYYNIDQINSLVETKKKWILNKLAARKVQSGFPAKKELKNSDTIPFLGRDLEILIQQNQDGVPRIRVEGERLLVDLPDHNNESGLIVLQWYKKQATEIIKNKVEKLNAKLGLRYNRLVIRSQKTRWGSCSYDGNLNFNWRLIMAPEPVIDYVIIHELMHLEEMNHKKGFWKLVAELCPQWRQHKKWLRDHGAELAMKFS